MKSTESSEKGPVPPVPPETYRWEDVRRQRALGGYPWAHLDKPPLGSKEDLNEHEYEPINPRPMPVETPPPTKTPQVNDDADVEEVAPKKLASGASSRRSSEGDFVRISLHEDVDMKLRDADADADVPDEKPLSPQELQTRMEERYFAATPTTTESRTDCDVNTSQLDSSGLEDLPLKRGSRKKKQEDGETPTRGFQQRIRSQAGRLRAKLRSMKMPERPKFNMPERPKFNLPDRPKFSMPERPKFNLPDRPKFSMPERPKFNFPERPKFNMPAMPSFSRSKSGSTKATSSTRRPLRDRASTQPSDSTASSTKKNLFDFDFKTYPRIFDRSKRKSDYATSSPKSTPRSQTPPPDMESTKKPRMPSRKKGPIGSRWAHRFSDIKYVDDEENRQDNEPRHRRGDSPDVRVIPLRDSSDEERAERERMEEMERLEEIEDAIRRRERGREHEHEVRDAVEEMEKQRQERDSAHTESTSAFHDKDYGYAVTVVETKKKEESLPDSDREQRSSGSSSDRHRAGVLEEIDSDEFFLREKGISHEDVNVGRYLTNEIRDAFRSPDNALSKVDDKYYYDDEDDAMEAAKRYDEEDDVEPVPPIRTRSLKPRKRTNKAPITAEEDTTNYFNTFPPARPKRNRRNYQHDGSTNQSKDEELILEENETAEGPTFLVTEHDDVSYEDRDGYSSKMDDDQWQDIEPIALAHPPTAPRRLRRSRVEQAPESSFKEDVVPEALRNGHHHWADDVDKNIVQEEVFALHMEPDYIIPGEPESPPVAPRRDRRKSSRGPSVHSLADEDRTSRGAESLQSEQEEREERVKLREVDMQETGGYATVDKIYPTKPTRAGRPKPARPPAPTRRKRLNHFFSLPRKMTHAPPTRPLRNYSTLGPSRPARKERGRKTDDDYSRSGPDDVHGSNRDLNSGEVIRKMKGRPLPAPPRPPRKTRDAQDGSMEQDGEEIFETIAEPEISTALGALNDTVFYSQKEAGAPVTFPKPDPETNESLSSLDREAFLVQGDIEVESELMEEVSVATQTDPVPDDFCMEVEDDEPKAHADACTETTEPIPQSTQTSGGRTLPSEENVERTEAKQEASIPQSTQTSSEEKTLVSEEVQRKEAQKETLIPQKSSEERKLASEEVVERTEVQKEASIPQSTQMSRDERMLASEEVTSRVEVRQEAPRITEERREVEPVRSVPLSPPQEPLPPPPPTIIERQVPVYIMPDTDTVLELKAEKLQIAELDVERMNVGELTARKIMVSDIDGALMQVAELSSKSGKLVLNGIELPPGFLQEIYDSFPRPEPVPPPPPPPAPVAAAPPPEPTPPIVPPLPMHIPMESMYSFIPSAMRVPRSRAEDAESEEEMISFIPTSHRRRRHQHHASKHSQRYSTDEEEEVVSFHPRRQASRTEQPGQEPTVGELGRQLVSAVQTSSMRAMRSLLQYTASHLEGEDKRRELQTAICILLVLVAGLILMGFGTGKPQHHHHWDYFNPPNN